MSTTFAPDRCPVEPRPDAYESFAALDLGDGSLIIFEGDVRGAWIESTISVARDEAL
ncbi:MULTISPECIES: hypothetical protein [Haloferax]|uniref:Uncharacterized protein n=1 Tax=Haloferax mediterranei (strain ATCC 33500 / DSM 1411 / JCM 8866 / NBRC 14739 / NCIMB 2177 / R-4) TaxID=523841 RepID=I3RBE5_HALMT|nr:hypothetical protein [Haloferax mediterranei]AFK21555.1 hypothetical protein HFX_6436 [Haloferax mediterranei ATCC 33500]ELZ97136.1 hypothetical protein C439_17478 [Haloferax mediterranei ATCC 33500]MDX5990121.1 hypothetical protein [Haloferax mediterranei ATCC 33500]